MLRSFLSAVAGWLTATTSLTLSAFTWHHPPFSRMLRESAIITAPIIFVVWLLLLLPLFLLVPSRSRLWHPLILLPCGAAAGTILLLGLEIFVFGFSWREAPSFPYLFAGPLVGFVTCAVGGALKRRQVRAA